MTTNDHIEVITLGTGGGPLVSASRAGTATLVRLGSSAYLFDCGMGSIRHYRNHARWGELKGIFLTHLHSDHIYDLGSYLVTGWEVPGECFDCKVVIRGPGKPERPPAHDFAESDEIADRLGDRTSHGTKEAVEALLNKVFGADIAIRMADEGRSEPSKWFDVADIEVPDDACAVTNRWCPDMEPIEVYKDEKVSIKAILVDHRLCYPSYGYRLDSAAGSVVISGDTTTCENVVKLARGADILCHEVIAFERMLATIPPGPTRAGIVTHLRESHTPDTEVGKIATRAGVKHLVLTHIVPNLPDAVSPEELISAAARDFDGQISVAEDGDVYTIAKGA